MKLLTIRNRSTGSEISVQDTSGKEYTFWRVGYKGKDKANCLAWATPLVTAEKEVETAEITKSASVEAEATGLNRGFIDWIKANKDNPEVKSRLRELAKIKQWPL